MRFGGDGADLPALPQIGAHDASVLYAFDVDGTLIRSYMRERPGGRRPVATDYDIVTPLPNRINRIAELARSGGRFAIVTNQGGVAMGYNSVPQVQRKMGAVLAAFDFFLGQPISVHIACGHPNARVEWARQPEEVRRRKPSPVMLQEAMRAHGMPRTRVAYVGDMDTDRAAAEAAQVAYFDAEEFFACT